MNLPLAALGAAAFTLVVVGGGLGVFQALAPAPPASELPKDLETYFRQTAEAIQTAVKGEGGGKVGVQIEDVRTQDNATGEITGVRLVRLDMNNDDQYDVVIRDDDTADVSYDVDGDRKVDHFRMDLRRDEAAPAGVEGNAFDAFEKQIKAAHEHSGNASDVESIVWRAAEVKGAADEIQEKLRAAQLYDPLTNPPDYSNAVVRIDESFGITAPAKGRGEFFWTPIVRVDAQGDGRYDFAINPEVLSQRAGFPDDERIAKGLDSNDEEYPLDADVSKPGSQPLTQANGKPVGANEAMAYRTYLYGREASLDQQPVLRSPFTPPRPQV